MPLRNRLEEVINRYERATQLVKSYKEGELSEDVLGSEFKKLREDRKAVHKNNQSYIKEQRRLHLGPKVAEELEKDEEKEEEEETVGSEEVDEDDDSYEDEEDEEEEEEEEEKLSAIDGSPMGDNVEDATVEMSKSEKKLWKQYGSFWKG